MEESAAKQPVIIQSGIRASGPSGAFKRFAAYLIDNILIVVVGLLFFPFTFIFEKMGRFEWLPMFLVGIIYFTLFDSHFLDRGSPGKTIMKIKLLGRNGTPISPLKAAVRAIAVVFPLFNGQIGQLFPKSYPQMVGYLYILLVVIFGAGISLFLVFNPSKQGIQDLLFDTSVIPVNQKNLPPSTPLSMKPFIASLIGAGLWAMILIPVFRSMPQPAEILALNERLKAEFHQDNIAA
ncbi:MAG: RDD family protein, partial [Pseudobdellovibrionaceae bacterium]